MYPFELATIGDNVVDCYVDDGWMYPGGNAVNVAVHGTRLGLRSTYIGAIGTDAAGSLVKTALLEEGVDLSASRIVEGPNATATVHLVDGNRTFGAGTPGVSRFVPTAEQLKVLSASEIVHTGDCSMLEDHIGEIREASGQLSFDFSVQPWTYVERIAPYVDIAICAASEGESSEGRALSLCELGPSIVVVTLGSAGADLLAHGDFYHADAGDGPVVDTLGAGDALTSRFLFGVIRGEDLRRSLDAATSYATKLCGSYGAFGHRARIDAKALEQ